MRRILRGRVLSAVRRHVPLDPPRRAHARPRLQARASRGEDGGGGAGGAGRGEVDAGAELRVVVGARPDQPVDPLLHLAVPDDDESHAADARPLAVGCFKIDGRKVLHDLRKFGQTKIGAPGGKWWRYGRRGQEKKEETPGVSSFSVVQSAD